ncbi:MAG TPA: recombinase family protein [Planctomycetaceae bacterium]|jgi:DNA invertase Pin-like site-specific DNA recombinase|nr:recombinase family protein [Planctomycetaceae bacterium]
MTKTAMTKAVSYLRVSGKGQLDGDGFDRQRDTIGKYAKRAGLDVCDEYREEGVSGTNDLDDRPSMGALLDRLESNGVRIVLVENASRLARDLMVQEIILDRFRKLEVRVIECDGGNELTVDDGNPTQTLIRQVLGAVAQFEKSVLVYKLRAARTRQRRTTGRCEGRKPYGHRDGEAQIVSRIIGMRRKPRGGERLSLAAIADELNLDGVPTRYGKPWAAETIRAICERAKTSKQES